MMDSEIDTIILGIFFVLCGSRTAFSNSSQQNNGCVNLNSSSTNFNTERILSFSYFRLNHISIGFLLKIYKEQNNISL